MCEALLMLSRDTSGALRDRLAAATGGQPTARAELAGVEIAVWAVHGEPAAALARAPGRNRYTSRTDITATRPPWRTAGRTPVRRAPSP